jgi:predicted DNA-binding transcriptional regulator YafY
MKLYNTIKELIIEQVQQSKIVDAIKNKYVCELKYEDDTKLPRGTEKRIIQPVALGKSKINNVVIRAYQTEGPSLKVNKKGVPLPDWRLFRVDRIKFFKPLQGETFTEPPQYNPNGDKSMNRVDVNSKF